MSSFDDSLTSTESKPITVLTFHLLHCCDVSLCRSTNQPELQHLMQQQRIWLFSPPWLLCSTMETVCVCVCVWVEVNVRLQRCHRGAVICDCFIEHRKPQIISKGQRSQLSTSLRRCWVWDDNLLWHWWHEVGQASTFYSSVNNKAHVIFISTYQSYLRSSRSLFCVPGFPSEAAFAVLCRFSLSTRVPDGFRSVALKSRWLGPVS